MRRHISLPTLLLIGIFTALVTAGATPARATDGCAPADFRLARGFDTGARNSFPPTAVAAADFNGDGRLDLAATHTEDNDVAVLLNDGTGWFGAPTKFGTGVRPWAVVVADFNGDGRPDLAVANSGSGNVSVLLGLGGGNFGPASNFAVGGSPRSLAVGDFNADGKPDLAVGHTDSDNVWVLLGDGAGSFAPAGVQPGFTTDVRGLDDADFNSDGKLDLAVAAAQGLFLLTGDGAGGFSAPSEIGPVGGYAVKAADLNGDGKADLLHGSFGGMVVRLGDGAGNFSAPSSFTRDGGGNIEVIALGDLDGDGKTDAAVAGDRAGFTYFKGDGAGGFTPARTYLPTNHPNTFAIGDFDGDGDRDVVAGNSLLLNAGGGVFEAARAAHLTNSPSGFTGGFATDLALGDFNDDGRADMAVPHRLPSGVNASVGILLDDGAGGFNPAAAITYTQGMTAINRAVTADFNKDGKTDVGVVGTTLLPFAHVLAVSLGNGDGTFAEPTLMNISTPASNPWDLAVYEFNGDNNPDLVITGGSGFLVLNGNGAGGFGFGAAFNVGLNVDRVAVGHFNGDAHQDFVVTDFGDRRVLVVFSNGAGQIIGSLSLGVGGLPVAVAVGDFNDDGRHDLATANRFSASAPGILTEEGSVSVLLSDGAGGFAAPVNYEVGPAPEDILAADFDGDGKLDLAVGNKQPAAFYVLSGDGAGAFSNAAAHYFMGGHTALAAHDFDGDTRLDLAGVVGSGPVGILLGKTPAALPCLFTDDASVTEGDAGTTNAAVTVRLSGPGTQAVRVSYALRGASAVEGQDFTGGSGTLTFQPGETTKTVPVPVVGDPTDELDETFSLHLSSPVNARLSDPVAQISISDNDAPPSLSINDVTVTEGNTSGTTAAVFTVTLSAPSAVVTRVDFSAAAGTASPNDFSLAPGTLVFGSGETSKTVTVSVRADDAREPDETFFVNLSNPRDATIADGQGQGTILDDDPVPTVNLFDAVGSEANGAESTVNMLVRLTNASSLPVSVDYATSDGTATAGSDYVAASGTVTFNPGETQKTIALTVKDDALDEATESFNVSLSNPVNVAVGDAEAICQVADNEMPAISINDVTVVEGNGGRTNATFTISLSAPTPEGVGVRVVTANGTANSNVSPNDYLSANIGVFEIPPGATSATFTVAVVGDHVIEPDETFFVNLSNPLGATIADAQGVGTITNDDTTSVQFATNAVTVNEADGSVQLTVTRVGDLSGVFVANYATSIGGTASDRSDYNAALGALRFEPNEASKTVTVFITNDVHVEDAETFFVGLTGPEGGVTNAPSRVTVTVNSDDAALGPNPIDETAFFVRQHYRDFLGRDPDAAGLAFWVGGIESCGADQSCREVKRVDTSAAFFLSIEFQETGYLAYRMYKAAYGDATSNGVPGTVPVIRLREFLSDAQRVGQGVQVGVGDWQQQLEANKNAYALEFVQRARFAAAFPATLTAEEFVNRLVGNTGAALSPEERGTLVTVLGATPADATKRAQAVRAVAEDANLRQAELNRAFVLMQYYGYLRRNPDDPQDTDFGGWKFWLDKLEQFNGNFVQAEMVKAFITSIEYRQRFGQ